MRSDWPEVALGDVAEEVTVGHVGPMASRYVDSGVPFLRSQNVQRLRIDLDDVKFIPPDFHSQLSKSRLRPGDVVVVRTGAPGTCAVVPDELADANCSDLVIIRPGPRINAGFLAYYVNEAAAHHVASHLVGAVQQHFNVGSARALPIRLPSIAEQELIVGVLGPLDHKVEQNRRTGRALEELARATFKAWFVDFEPVKAKARGTGFQPVGLSGQRQDAAVTRFPGMPAAAFAALPDRLTDSPLGPVPEGWEVGKLGDFCDINKQSVRTGQIDGEIEYIDIASVTVGRLDGVQRVSFAEAPSRARRRVRHGDTIWSCVRPNRRSYLFIHSPPESRIASTGFAVLSPATFGPSYLYELTTRQEFVDYLVANADGSAYPAVRPKHFAATDVLVPPAAVRDAFEQVTMPLRDLVAAGEAESSKLAALRDYLLPRLLSGRVRVREAEASVEAMA